MSKSQLVRKKGQFRGQNLESDDNHISLASEVSPLDSEVNLITCHEACEEPNNHDQCRNPSLGLTTKARACEGVGRE
jgi:hypothetical protein